MTARPGGRRPDRPRRAPLAVDLALQGGGTHGAFTWGVLDRLLDEPWLRIEGISGTSAGAMNAVMVADGFAADGARGAQASLERFWREIARAAAMSPLQRGPLDVLLGQWALDPSPVLIGTDLLTRLFSPHQPGSAGHDLLAEVLRESAVYDRLAGSPIRLFLTATNARTGRGRVFRNAEVTPLVLLASACLPTMFQAIEIDGEPYWDGSYAGHPTIRPLVRECDSRDTIVVQIDPMVPPRKPRTAREILGRLSEVSFNATLIRELRTIAVLRAVPDPGTAEGARWAAMRVHRISSDVRLTIDHSSKLRAEWSFLMTLRDCGRRAADEFLALHGDDLGRTSSFDLDAVLCDWS